MEHFHGTHATGDLLAAVRRELLPLLDDVMRQLTAEENEIALRFFGEIATQITRADAEEDLLQPFHQLCLSAMLMLQAPVSSVAWQTIDELLARAHLISWTLSADSREQ
ncbi:MAG: hypothetical protein H6Q33_3429 [Deltaproteobacteria bacterium]|jgi:hypothetical protein|nr:hypothetical protein [Deltaproteobacteria bacterium]